MMSTRSMVVLVCVAVFIGCDEKDEVGGGDSTGGVHAYAAGAGLTLDGSTFAIAPGGVTSDKIAADAVTAEHLASGAVTADQLAPGAITGDAIAAGAVTYAKLDSTAASAGQLLAFDGTAWAPTNLSIPNQSIVASQIATGAIGQDAIAVGSVSASKLSFPLQHQNAYDSALLELSNTGTAPTLALNGAGRPHWSSTRR